MSINLHFTEQDWERVEHNWSAWWAGELDRPLVVIESLEIPPRGILPEAYHFTTNYPVEMRADDVLDCYQANLEAKRFYGDAWPRWWPNFGPGIVAGFLGAEVHCAPDTVWFGSGINPLGDSAELMDIAGLHLAYDAENLWWRRVQELTRRAIQRWENQVCVTFTDLGGNLDILAHLLTTERLLFCLHDAPEEVERLSVEITRLWLRYYDELYADIRIAGRGTAPWAPIWASGRCYMLQSDFSYMISPKMFERFVLPDLETCCAALDYPFYHLDGKGQIAHLDMLLALPYLRGIQWVPGEGQPPPEEWMPLLKRIRDAGKLCQLKVSPAGARAIAHELGGCGFAFYIPERLSRTEAEDLIRVLTEEGRL